MSKQKYSKLMEKIDSLKEAPLVWVALDWNNLVRLDALPPDWSEDITSMFIIRNSDNFLKDLTNLLKKESTRNTVLDYIKNQSWSTK